MSDSNEAYRGVAGFLRLLDLSSWPKDNIDRKKKLGKFLQTFVATVIEEEAGAARTADGQAVKNTFLSHWPIEPDIVNLRIHEPNGVDNVYDFGLIVDHSAAASSDLDRSTVVKDQGSAITWAVISDILRVSQRLTNVLGKSMDLTAAGFPSLLAPTRLGRGLGTRGAVSLNISRNQGFADDGKEIGQLGHVVCFPPPTAGKGPGKTQTSKAGSTKAGGGGTPPKPKELLMRADMGIRFGNLVGRLMNEPDGDASEGSKGDEKRKVKLFLDTPAPPDDHIDTAENGLTSHKDIPKDVPKLVIHGVVRVPKSIPTSPDPEYPGDESHHDYSYHGGTSDGGGDSGGGSATPSNGGVEGGKGSGSAVPDASQPSDTSKPGGDPGEQNEQRTRVVKTVDGFGTEYWDPETREWRGSPR